MAELSTLTDSQILELLGTRLRKARLRRNLTQEALAERAGLSVSTIKGLEAGRGRLDSLIAVLRELRQLDGLDRFVSEPEISPLQLAKRQGKLRKRASGGRKPGKASSPTDESSW